MNLLRFTIMNALFLVPTVLAQDGAGPQIQTFGDVIAAGGWPMKVIIAFSIAGLALVIWFLFTLRSGILYPKQFLREAGVAADDGDLEALEAVCRASRSPAARIITAATEQISATQRLDYMAVRDAVEDEGSRQANVLWQRLQYLMDVAVISPMVGLLGTVLGMLESFASMETELGAVRPLTISQGVAKALITTAGGLIVGIAAMILYAVFRGYVNRLLARLEESCSLILRRFVGNYTERRNSR
ncbi:MAG: MotA/TolQ/ExbB proton channel family protein [Candidatus Pacebacteria bacterium]|nr:MotA/TolQ/ExbB proton channel family protein [Candidatus Paceibacterota bacterium]